MRHALTAALALIGVLALACLGDDDDGDAVQLRTPTLTPTASETPSPTATAAATPAPVTTATARATATPVPAPTAPLRPVPTPASADLAGSPFSTHDVRVAVEGANYSFWPADVEPFCLETAVPGLPFWSANLAGSDFGPVYMLWVYPDLEALRADWQVTPGERPELLVEGCELPYGFVWWNENAVMAFQVFLGPDGESGLAGSATGPAEFPAVRAFLELAP